MLCLCKEGLREDWLYQLSHPHKIKSLLTYLLTSTCVLEAEPGTLDIKRRESGIQFNYQLTSWFTLQTSEYGVIIVIACMLSYVSFPLLDMHHDYL